MKSHKKIFISYERGDFEIASRLYYDLKKHGLSPWLDKIDLFVGQNWKLAIKKAIKESDYFLALLSKNSISKRGYVQKELKIALEMLDELVDSEIFIIPVRLDECVPNDEKLLDIHWADIYRSYEDGLKLILKAFEIDTGKRISDEDKSEIPFMRYGTKIKPYSRNEINEILEIHRIWIESKKEKGEQAIFINADLRKFDFSNAELQETNFQGANLQEAIFQNANLHKTNFREAHLYSVNFKNANLEEADLTEAYLHDTNMQNTNLQSANLERAMLNESFLIHTKLGNTKLTGAILKNIKTDITTISMIPNELIEIFGNSFFIQGWTDFKKNSIIERHIIFPPEYQQAGMSVLTYFNSIIIDKYPDTKVSVTIKQENLKVTMIVETPEGKKEEIQKTLDQYGMIITGKLDPNVFFENKLNVLALENQLAIAKVQIENQKRLLNFADSELKEAKFNIKQLLSIVEKGLSTNDKSKYNINVDISPTISQGNESKALGSRSTDISGDVNGNIITGNDNKII